MKRILAAASACVLLLAGAARAEQGTEEKAFVAGGQIRLNLSAGDYTIKAGRDDRILVAWQTHRDPDDQAHVTIRTDIGRKSATVATDGPHGNFRVVIEVPSHSDLHVDLSAGDLLVEGITGNKDLGSWAGDIDVEIQRPEDYRRVDVAVKAGDIVAHPFGATKSGLFRSVSWNGPGQYVLRVRLTAGDLRLYGR